MRGLAAFAAAGLAYFALSAGAFAQEDLEKGKSGAQIFATDCAICHKTPQAAVKGGAPGEGFLRQHYTSSQQSAAAVAAYLRTIKAPASAERGSKSKGAKPAAAKPKGVKEAKPPDKPSEAKPSDAKPAEPKASEKKEPAEKKD
jgi:mono/diheme cytochrome c family protein